MRKIMASMHGWNRFKTVMFFFSSRKKQKYVEDVQRKC